MSHDAQTGDTAPSPPRSKTQRKREMHDLQALGAALAALDAAHLAAFDLPERLVDALNDLRTITRHEARRRQMQYVGRLMRDVDPEPIAAALARLQEGPRADKARFAAVEGWRDRLIDDDAALAEFVAAHPAASADALRPLIAAARDERRRGAPPRDYRRLFRALKSIDDAAHAGRAHDGAAGAEAAREDAAPGEGAHADGTHAGASTT
ncbi:MAG TPA: ribosome biogenesis factor YjgA [Casimicrobiaceae bacterium]|nr:ribosome biogenesis factor YjgA [Casimicrobiaceae bacterium]